MAGWIEALQARHHAAFGDRDWQAHVRDLNDSLGLTGRYRFTESRWPPEFFIGALARFEPGRWLAVISLNPKELSPTDRTWHEDQAWTPEEHWAYLTRADLRDAQVADFYYRKWAYPLLLLFSELSGEQELLERPEESYFYRVGAFELIPYASHEYAPGTYDVMLQDPGCVLSREVALAAMSNCPPAAVIANGLDSAAAVPGWLPLDHPPVEHRYASVSRPGKTLRHWQSSISMDGHRVPYAGFPFLRSQSGHNSFDEIRQLAREILARA